MAELIWTEPALQDLDVIADYIALDNPVAAQRLVQKVFSSVEILQSFPKMGLCPPELANSPYRQLVIIPCRIFYRIEKNVVYILHAMRGEQLFRARLIEELNSNK